MKFNFIIKNIRLILLASFLAFASASSHAAIERLVVFGDSLSDTGNTRSQVPFGTFGPIAAAAGYGPNGRFSNGILWHEYLARELGVSAATNSRGGGDNFAYGGARVDNESGPSTGLLRQTNEYFARQGGSPSDTDALFISWIGGNDVRDLVGNPDPIDIIDQQLDALFGTFGRLLDSGVTRLLVPNLPNLGAIPENLGTSNQASATAATQAWNDNLLTRLFDLNESTSADIFFLDVFSIFDDILADPASEGFANTTGQCRSTNFFGESECNNPETFVFWDAIHPTTAAHRILGEEAFRLVSTGNALVKASAPATLILLSLFVAALMFGRKPR